MLLALPGSHLPVSGAVLQITLPCCCCCCLLQRAHSVNADFTMLSSTSLVYQGQREQLQGTQSQRHAVPLLRQHLQHTAQHECPLRFLAASERHPHCRLQRTFLWELDCVEPSSCGFVGAERATS